MVYVRHLDAGGMSPGDPPISAFPRQPAPMSRSNIPALPPITQGLPCTSVGGSGSPHPLPTSTERQELPLHRALSVPPHSSPTTSNSLEGRVAALEQANCSLLEELVRLHSKLRVGQRGGVDEKQEELGSVRSQVQQVEEELRGLSSQVLRATVERQSAEETSRQLQLSVEGVEAKIAASLSGLTTWRDSFQSRLGHVEGEMRVQWQGMQQTTGDLQRSMEQAGESLWQVEREGGERAVAMNGSLKVLCSRMDAADSRHQHMESALHGLQEDLRGMFSQQEAWQKDSAHRFAQLEVRVAEVAQAVDGLRIALTDCERASSERLSALEGTVVEGLAEQDKSLQLMAKRLEETTSEAEKERERLFAALQAVAEGAQRELNCAEARLLSRIQGAELQWEEVSRSQREAAAVEHQQVQEEVKGQLVQLGTQISRHGDDLTSTVKRERVHTSKAMSALSNSIKLVQREGEASRRHLSNVLHAEVTVRQRELDAIQSAVKQVSRHLKEETFTRISHQQELEVAQAKMRERLQRESAELLGAVHSSSERVLRDVESRFRTAHTTLMRLEQQDLDKQTRVSKLQQAVEASSKDLSQQIEAEQAARKAALAHLGELIQGRVSLEMHHEETGRHQEAHRQMDHYLAALRTQVTALQSSLNQLHMQAASEASHERGQLRGILARLQAHLGVEGEEPSHDSRQLLGGQDDGGGTVNEQMYSPSHVLEGGGEGFNSVSRDGVDSRGGSSNMEESVSAVKGGGEPIHSARHREGEEVEEETESSTGDEEGEEQREGEEEEEECNTGDEEGADSKEELQLQSSSNLVEGIPLDVEEGDILDTDNYDVITLDGEERPSSDGQERLSSDGQERFSSDGQERLSSDGQERLSSDGQERLSSDGQERLSSDGQERPSSDGQERLSSDGQERLSSDGQERPSSDGQERLSSDGQERLSSDGQERPSSNESVEASRAGSNVSVPSVMEGGEQMRECSPLCSGGSVQGELSQGKGSGGGELLVEPEEGAEEEEVDSTVAPPSVPHCRSTVLPRTSSVFIKYEDEEVVGAGSLNQWGVYQAWRLLKIKAAWMRPLHRKAAEQQRDIPQ